MPENDKPHITCLTCLANDTAHLAVLAARRDGVMHLVVGTPIRLSLLCRFLQRGPIIAADTCVSWSAVGRAILREIRYRVR